MQRKKAKEKRMSHSLNSRWSKYNKDKSHYWFCIILQLRLRFIRQRTNFRPAEKFDGTLRSHQTVRLLFLLCSNGTLNDQASKFSYCYGRSVCTEHLNARQNFQPVKIRSVPCERSFNEKRERKAFSLTLSFFLSRFLLAGKQERILMPRVKSWQKWRLIMEMLCREGILKDSKPSLT